MGKAKLHTPQEVEVHYILPALRKAITEALKAKGMSQKEIAGLLKVTEPAISQYLNSKRATNVEFNSVVKEAIQGVADTIEDSDALRAHTQDLLHVVRKEGITCSLCKPITDMPEDCNICFRK